MSTLKQVKNQIKQSGGKDRATELNLSGIKIQRFTPEITTAIQECRKLENLILSDCDLVSLEGMPKIKLLGIDLSNNKLCDAEIKHLKEYSKLYQLLLTDNQIENIDSIKQLSACSDLIQLDITGNPVASKQDYRSSIFESIKSLTALDGKDADGNEVQEEEEDDDDDDDQDGDEDQQFSEDDQDQEYDEEQDSEDDKPKKNQKKGSK